MPLSGWFSGLSSPPTQSLTYAPPPPHLRERASRRRANATQSAPVTPPNGPSIDQPSATIPTPSTIKNSKGKRQFKKSRTELLRTPDHIPHDIEAKTQVLMTAVTRNFFDPLPAEHRSNICEVVETSTRHAQQNRALKAAIEEREDYILALHQGLDAEVLVEKAQKEELARELSQVKAELVLVKIPSRSSEPHDNRLEDSSEPSASLIFGATATGPASVSAPVNGFMLSTTIGASQRSEATQTDTTGPSTPLSSSRRPALPRRSTDTALLCVESKEDLDVVSPFARLLSDRCGISYDEVLEKIIEITAKSFSLSRAEHIDVASPIVSPPVHAEQRASAVRSPSPRQASQPNRSPEATCSGSVLARSHQKPRTRRPSNTKATVFTNGNVRTRAGGRRVTLPKWTRHRNTRGFIDEDSPADPIFPEPTLAG